MFILYIFYYFIRVLYISRMFYFPYKTWKLKLKKPQNFEKEGKFHLDQNLKCVLV